MFARLRKGWRQLRSDPPGQRFQRFHGRAQHAPRWVRFVYVGLAIALLPLGVLFAFIPGPAVVFFAVSAALFGTQSAWMARHLDRLEVAVRGLIARLRASWHARHGT